MPAFAGKQLSTTHAVRYTPACAGDSPRRMWFATVNLGTPLRMQGKPRLETGERELSGYTPACAGDSVKVVSKKAPG